LIKLIGFLVIFFLFVTSCVTDNSDPAIDDERFTSEISELKEYFKIPGLAVSIVKNEEIIYQNYLGVSDFENSTQLDSNNLFPIASLTKIFSTVLIMKLVEENKLSLEDSIDEYLTSPVFGDSILIKHVLSHTSQGAVGKEFYYSSRFGMLTNVIENASGMSFEEFMKKQVIEPLNLKNTFLLKDSTQLIGSKYIMAKPYILENGIEQGFVDFGFSAAAGIVSNLEDLVIFNNALDMNLLISKDSKELMYTPFDKKLPYGFGMFTQEYKNLNLVWAYGQYVCYSSLWLKIPSKNITLLLLANNNLLSDPARLIYGDVTSSMFALSFLKNYIFGLDDISLVENKESISKIRFSDNVFYRRKILAQALSESYMARFDSDRMQLSTELLNLVFSEFPNYLEYADLNLLHILSFLKDVAFYMDLGEFNRFDKHLIDIGEMLLRRNERNPYVHSYLGAFYARLGKYEKAKYHFETIVNADNFSENWYTKEALSWLIDHQ